MEAGKILCHYLVDTLAEGWAAEARAGFPFPPHGGEKEREGHAPETREGAPVCGGAGIFPQRSVLPVLLRLFHPSESAYGGQEGERT